jgi:hypothetical protein
MLRLPHANKAARSCGWLQAWRKASHIGRLRGPDRVTDSPQLMRMASTLAVAACVHVRARVLAKTGCVKPAACSRLQADDSPDPKIVGSVSAMCLVQMIP